MVPLLWLASVQLPLQPALKSPLKAVLFDLDGTLVDSAPDLIGALNRLRQTLDLPEIESAPLREVAGRGAVAILKTGLPEMDEAQREAFRDRFLDDYQAHCWQKSHVFDGVPDVLNCIEHSGLAWGIVTNKLMRLAQPVIEQAGWQRRCGSLIAGDSTSNPKPAPDPIVLACQQLGVRPEEALFVGDDLRDIQAGRAAGCKTAAAHWGYIAADQCASDWRADLDFTSARELLSWLQVNLARPTGVAQ
ncbi:MAG: HAD-IA family hydrolase [Pseudomonadota bacterium]